MSNYRTTTICTSCYNGVIVPDDYIGEIWKCPFCQAEIMLPSITAKNTVYAGLEGYSYTKAV